jgi:hypothetical protein
MANKPHPGRELSERWSGIPQHFPLQAEMKSYAGSKPSTKVRIPVPYLGGLLEPSAHLSPDSVATWLSLKRGLAMKMDYFRKLISKWHWNRSNTCLGFVLLMLGWGRRNGVKSAGTSHAGSLGREARWDPGRKNPSNSYCEYVLERLFLSDMI